MQRLIFATAAVIGLAVGSITVPVGAAMAAPEPPPFGCPEGWVDVRHPVNPALKCLPNTIAPRGGTTLPAPEPPPFGCPEGWARVDPALNPVIQCLPDSFAPS